MRQRPRGMSSGRLPYRLIRLKRCGCPMVGSVQFSAHVSAASMNNLVHFRLPLVAYKRHTNTGCSFAVFVIFYSIYVFLFFFIDSLSQTRLFPEIRVGKVGQVCMLYCGVGAKMFTRLRLTQWTRSWPLSVLTARLDERWLQWTGRLDERWVS